MNRLDFAPLRAVRPILIACVLLALAIGQLAWVHRAAAATELELWTYYGDTGPAADCMNKSTADFAKSQDKYTVKIRNIPFSSFNQEVTTGIASNTTPDILIVDNPDSARYASIGALADLTDKIKAWGQADKYLS